MKKLFFFIISAFTLFSQEKDSTKSENLQKYGNNEKIRVAVVPFKNNTGSKDFDPIAAGIGESIISHLSGLRKFKFIERMQMDKAMKEQDFQMSDQVDAGSVQEAGKILGVEYIFIGDLQKFKDRLRINARRMRVEDGKLEEAVSAEGPEDDLFDLQDEIGEKLKDLFEE